MLSFRKTVLPILLATVWISISEFLRNQVLFNSYWTEHYKKLGLVFPGSPANGAMWGVWSLCYAISIFVMCKKFSLWQAAFLSWFVGFVLMWIVIGNLGVLPFSLLYYAVPLSIVEAGFATYIIKKMI